MFVMCPSVKGQHELFTMISILLLLPLPLPSLILSNNIPATKPVSHPANQSISTCASKEVRSAKEVEINENIDTLTFDGLKVPLLDFTIYSIDK